MTRTATVTVRRAATPADIEFARTLFVEYAQWLKVDLCFQDFDRELATLPGAYAPPNGRLLLAGGPDQAFGCVALRPLATSCGARISPSAGAGATRIGEVKRLYVRPANRSGGSGRLLVETLIADARAIGYAELKLDTLAWMTEARKLYARLGFRECESYYDNPIPGTSYMVLAL